MIREYGNWTDYRKRFDLSKGCDGWPSTGSKPK